VILLNAPASISQVSFNSQAEEEPGTRYAAAGDKKRFEDVCTDIGDVWDVTILADIVWFACSSPCGKHSYQSPTPYERCESAVYAISEMLQQIKVIIRNPHIEPVVVTVRTESHVEILVLVLGALTSGER
jgi:hypothetical protein